MRKSILLIGVFAFVVFTRGVAQQLNTAIVDGKVDSVWQGIGLPQGYTGKDVIIGFTDWGFDYTHPVFYDTNLQQSRILAVWDQFRQGGNPPDGFSYGSLIEGETNLLTNQCDTFNVYEYAYHGTHVASIAAGSGFENKYRGVAFGTQLLFATFLVDEQAVIDAFNWMYNVAQNEGKRLVINMSWGLYYVGNMDGTGKVAQVMDSLTEKGVVFVTSAGNNGDERFHIDRNFSTVKDTLGTCIDFSPLSYSAASWGQSVTMTSSQNASFEFALQIMTNNSDSLLRTDFFKVGVSDYNLDTFLIVGADTLYFKLATEACNVYNQRPNARLRIKKPVANWRIGMLVVADSGHFHAWNVAELTNGVGNWGNSFYITPPTSAKGWIAGDYYYGIGAPANIDCTISIAAHSTKQGYSKGNIASFSSYGPVLGSNNKPDVSAPGVMITAALSSFTNTYSGSKKNACQFKNRTYHFADLSGTSMSSPFAAGVVALMLEANPTLTTAEIKEIIFQTATQDGYTQLIGAERFGAGKINAYLAVKEAAARTNIINPLPISALKLYPNPAKDYIDATLDNKTSDNQTLSICDMTGKVVKIVAFGNSTTVRIDVTDLPQGFYIVKMGNQFAKFVK